MAGILLRTRQSFAVIYRIVDATPAMPAARLLWLTTPDALSP